MQGPGGYYNLGNPIGLVSGLVQAIVGGAANAGEAAGPGAGIQDHVLGSPAAVALSMATILLFIGAELYHQAWRAAAGTDPALLRCGDLFAAFGALALAVSLACVGNVALALTAAVLHAAGRLGSVLMPRAQWILRAPGLPPFDPFRIAVVASRLPAVLAIAFALFPPVLAGTPAPADVATQQAILLPCALWTRADLLLLRAR